MRENDGRKLDHKTLEVLRLRAVEQVNAGARPDDVAAALGLHRTTVYGWVRRYGQGGRGALLAKPVPGRPPRLSALQMRELWGLVVGSDPRQLQLGVPRSFRTADPYRIFSRKDGNSWQANIGISLPSFVRKPPGWWSRTHGLSRWWPASSG